MVGSNEAKPLSGHPNRKVRTFPRRLEAGTLNLLGVIGLSAGLDFVMEKGMGEIHSHEMALLTRLRDGLCSPDGMELYCCENLFNHLAVMTVNVNGLDPGDVGAILDGDFGIAIRVGPHCAPVVHEWIGTYPRGGVRFSIGPFNTMEGVDRSIQAMRSIAQSGWVKEKLV